MIKEKIHKHYHKKMEYVKNKWQNNRFTNIITRRLKMWKSKDKIKDSQILSEENGKCKKSNDKTRDSQILSQEDWKCKNQMKK